VEGWQLPWADSNREGEEEEMPTDRLPLAISSGETRGLSDPGSFLKSVCSLTVFKTINE